MDFYKADLIKTEARIVVKKGVGEKGNIVQSMRKVVLFENNTVCVNLLIGTNS